MMIKPSTSLKVDQGWAQGNLNSHLNQGYLASLNQDQEASLNEDQKVVPDRDL